MQITYNSMTDGGGVVKTPFKEFSVKSYFFDEIHDCSRWDIVEQVGEVCRCIVFLSCWLKIHAVYQDVLDCEESLTSNALWWIFTLQQEGMSEVCMSDAKPVDEQLISSW